MTQSPYQLESAIRDLQAANSTLLATVNLLQRTVEDLRKRLAYLERSTADSVFQTMRF